MYCHECSKLVSHPLTCTQLSHTHSAESVTKDTRYDYECTPISACSLSVLHVLVYARVQRNTRRRICPVANWDCCPTEPLHWIVTYGSNCLPSPNIYRGNSQHHRSLSISSSDSDINNNMCDFAFVLPLKINVLNPRSIRKGRSICTLNLGQSQRVGYHSDIAPSIALNLTIYIIVVKW